MTTTSECVLGVADWMQSISYDDVFSDAPEKVERFKTLLLDGFFYLEMPDEWVPLVESAKTFGNTFYSNKDITSKNWSPFGGYHPREKFQVESLFTEQAYWEEMRDVGFLPQEVFELAHKMKSLGVNILQKSLEVTGIPKSDWDQYTALASNDDFAVENRGLGHLSFHHYRHGMAMEGMQEHYDFGFVTVLFIDKHGLQAKRDGGWWNISPKDKHVIINFGRALEWVATKSKVKAVYHRVVHVNEDRLSFGLFIDGNLTKPIWKKEADTGEMKVKFETNKEYIDWCFKTTYA